ncbi:MAG: hypothetical protein DME65_15065, partial [Verrucomicrobia bacterium]
FPVYAAALTLPQKLIMSGKWAISESGWGTVKALDNQNRSRMVAKASFTESRGLVLRKGQAKLD